jgi:ParB/RepB/Spo0J family partition protein
VKATAKVVTEVREIPIDRLYISPEETRKTMDQAALQDLAASIMVKGIQEPLLVRPIDLDCMSGEPLPGPARAGDAYELIAGTRRLGASKLAGKTTCPCIVREMSDEEARERRIVSNLQREDLPPLEEALAFRRLLEKPGATVETIAATLGKSPSYVGRRLKLVDAIEPVREALKAGAIEVGHALELARLSELQQKRLLTRLNVGYEAEEPDEDEDVEREGPEPGECRFCGCTEDDACEGGCSWVDAKQTVCSNPDCIAQWKFEADNAGKWEKTTVSIQALKRDIAQFSLKDLSAAPFPLDRCGLGAGPCTVCPKRSMNAALLFNDLAGTDTCTDRECFDEKAEAFVQIELEAAKKSKSQLLKVSRNWSNDKSIVYSYNVHIFKTDHECANGEAAIWIDGEFCGQHITICRDSKCKTHRSGSSSYSSSSTRTKATPKESAKAKAERQKVLEKVKEQKAYRSALFDAIAKAAIPAAALDTLILEVCAHVLEHMNQMYEDKFAALLGWDAKLLRYGGRKQLQEKLRELQPAERLRLALLSTEADELAVHEYSLNSKPDGLERIAKLLGLDPAKLRKPAEPKAAKPAQAKKATKPAKKAAPKKTKSILSGAARKRIAEAQKKRWAQQRKGGAK